LRPPKRRCAARSRLASARHKPSNDFLVRIAPKFVIRIAPTAMELVLLDGLFSELDNLFFGLSLILWKGHPLANDFAAVRVPATPGSPSKIGCCSCGGETSLFCSYTIPGRMGVNVAHLVVRMRWMRSSPYDAPTITRPNKEPGSKFISKNCATESIAQAPFRSR
jgi:hypothetical protein